MSKKILVIGGLGFIGVHLCKRLVTEGHDVKVLARQEKYLSTLDWAEKMVMVYGDVADPATVQNCVKGQDIVINLASTITKGKETDIISNFRVNCQGQLNVLQAVTEKNPDCQIIWMGSRSQFGAVESEEPICEDHPQNPFDIYGIHKQTAENYCKFYSRINGINVNIIRPSSVYGPAILGDNNKNVVNLFIKRALEGMTLNVTNKGKYLKDYIYVSDLIDAMILMIEKNSKNKIYNVGSQDALRLSDIAEMIIEKVGKGEIQYIDHPDAVQTDLKNTLMSIKRIKSELGWKPKTALKEGVVKTINHYKAEREQT